MNNLIQDQGFNLTFPLHFKSIIKQNGKGELLIVLTNGKVKVGLTSTGYEDSSVEKTGSKSRLQRLIAGGADIIICACRWKTDGSSNKIMEKIETFAEINSFTVVTLEKTTSENPEEFIVLNRADANTIIATLLNAVGEN